MSPPRKPVPKAAGPSKTSHLFGSRKPGDRSAAVTSESISADLDAFQNGGGRIEVLGITRTLSRIDLPTAEAPVPVVVEPAAKAARRR